MVETEREHFTPTYCPGCGVPTHLDEHGIVRRVHFSWCRHYRPVRNHDLTPLRAEW